MFELCHWLLQPSLNDHSDELLQVYLFPWSNKRQVLIYSGHVSCHITTFSPFFSVNVHDCSDCDMISAAMQIRTRDCHNMLISLLCATQPSIESSSTLELCPFYFSYPDLEGKEFFSTFFLSLFLAFSQFISCCFNHSSSSFLVQLQRAELSIFNNNWYQVFDFNASESEETNWTLVRGKVRFKNIFLLLFPSLSLSFFLSLSLSFLFSLSLFHFSHE